MARRFEDKLHAKQGIQLGTTSTAGHLVKAADSNGNLELAAKPAYTFHTQGGFAVGGPISSTDTIPTFFVSEASTDHVLTLEKIRYKVGVGTNVTFRLTKNGSEFNYGTTGTPLTATTTATTTSSSESLAEDDEIELDIIGISGSPSDLGVTLFFKHVVS